ncbi:MAG: ATP-binding protein [Candidatus Rifleibacteriota bacterium]
MLNNSRRFFISLLLIVFSFVILLAIAWNSLKFQQQFLAEKNIEERKTRLSHIAAEFVAGLKKSQLPPDAVSLPMAVSAYPDLKAPENESARQTFLKMAVQPEMKQAFLIEAELNAFENERDFWRMLLIQDYFENSSFFEMRKIATRLTDSNFDYLLDNGFTLKTWAVLKIAESFNLEGNSEAEKQWLYRLRNLPAPTGLIKTDVSSLRLSDELKRWFEFLVECYQLTNSPAPATGFHSRSLVLPYGSVWAAFQAEQFMNSLAGRFSAAGFGDLEKISSRQFDRAVPLSFENLTVWISFKNSLETQTLPGGFFLLLGLASLATIGFFGFALHEWRMLQRAQLLDQEEQFFRQTAHDLKTPITIVGFLAETLALKRYKSSEQQERYLNQLLLETQRAAELFDRLLLSVRLRKKTVQAELRPLSAGTALEGILARFKPRLSDWEIAFDMHEELELTADSDMFERVIINLIENVIRHAGQGKSLLLACRKMHGKPGFVEISIGDRGSGLPGSAGSDERNLLSGDLPYQPEKGGSGTGLFLVRQIMQIHQGDFYAKPRPDGGLLMITTWRTKQ